MKSESIVAQSCLTLSDPVDCSPPGSFVHGIFQARVLEWGAIAFSGESVNKLLAINNQENYSTLDICLVDLNSQIADFIKVGAPFGLIKRDGNVDVIESGALPIGALDNIKPSTFKTTISTKDIVILATDGIIDAFETEDNFKDFVLHLACNNPQTIAETILNEALNLNDMNAKDDMTVLVARIYLKN